jgi:hypothetical protein
MRNRRFSFRRRRQAPNWFGRDLLQQSPGRDHLVFPCSQCRRACTTYPTMVSSPSCLHASKRCSPSTSTNPTRLAAERCAQVRKPRRVEAIEAIAQTRLRERSTRSSATMPHPLWGNLGSKAKTMADTIDLHRMPLLAVRGPDAAMVKRVCCRLRRKMHGLGDDGPHSFGARSGGALLGFGDPLIVA